MWDGLQLLLTDPVHGSETARLLSVAPPWGEIVTRLLQLPAWPVDLTSDNVRSALYRNADLVRTAPAFLASAAAPPAASAALQPPEVDIASVSSPPTQPWNITMRCSSPTLRSTALQQDATPTW